MHLWYEFTIYAFQVLDLEQHIEANYCLLINTRIIIRRLRLSLLNDNGNLRLIKLWWFSFTSHNFIKRKHLTSISVSGHRVTFHDKQNEITTYYNWYCDTWMIYEGSVLNSSFHCFVIINRTYYFRDKRMKDWVVTD